MAVPRPKSVEDWIAEHYDPSSGESLTSRGIQRMLTGTEDSTQGTYAEYLQNYNEEIGPGLIDPNGNRWVPINANFGVTGGGEDAPWSLTGGEDVSDWKSSAYADLIQGYQYTNEQGISYIPEAIQQQITQRLASQSGGGFIKKWLNSPGPLMLLASLFTAGAASGFGVGGAAAATGEGLVTGAGGSTLSAADALGLQQMAATAGLPAGSAASEAFIASGGTMGSTAAGGLAGATLAESFGYTTPTVASVEGASAFDQATQFAKTYGKSFLSSAQYGLTPNVPALTPFDLPPVGEDAGAEEIAGSAPAQESVIGTQPGQVIGAGGGENPLLQTQGAAIAGSVAGSGATGVASTTGEVATVEDVPVPKPGAPNYQELWQNYAGWIDNVNRINEGAFADVRARLSAAGAAPELIKNQTEHLESQRKDVIGEFGKTTTYGLLQEGYDIAMGSVENRYEGGMSRYGGVGKPELMDFYTELYGAPARPAAGAGFSGTSGQLPTPSNAVVPNPWLDDSGRVSLLGA